AAQAFTNENGHSGSSAKTQSRISRTSTSSSRQGSSAPSTSASAASTSMPHMRKRSASSVLVGATSRSEGGSAGSIGMTCERSLARSARAVQRPAEKTSEAEHLRQVLDHDLVGAAADGDEPHVHECASRGALTHVPEAAVELDAGVRHEARHATGEELRHR